ncbi:hypothetical protein MNBD_GAMMA23-2138 [hydrothermal vent metagenome]|uniref:Zinc finger/thioredoxin putative domain-containing protein n=1 Tax=hydrothermal vent metagenome TaxID=652676 RepID=A0A3B1AG85_9ZZZZ
MYTRCPICKTNFSVSEAQLQVAQGKVRCGSCKNVFNARQHIHYRSTSSATIKNTKKETTTPSVIKKESSAPSIKQTAPVTKPASNKAPVPPPHSDIDAIFNALDSQLTSGTYIDIAQPADTDIREADFNDNDLNEYDEATEFHQPFAEDTSEPDLDLSGDLSGNLNSELKAEDLSQPSHFVIEENKINTKEPVSTSIDNSKLSSALANIKTNTPVKPTTTPKSPEPEPRKKKKKGGPQHTFDFLGLTDEPGLSPEDEEQFSAVNTPLNIDTGTPLNKKNENAALHEAIDNIIKVDSTITTPFEEQDDHHFVIEMNSEPDVELVDEDDIDKLFASTDSLKMSDLKFDKHLTNNQTEEPISILGENKNHNNPEPNIEFEPDSASISDEISTATQQTENETPFNLQVEEQLKPESFSAETSAPDYLVDNEFNETDFDPDGLTLEANDNDFDIEEEIVLASDTNKSSHNVPHQLRDAVASFDQQTPPLSTAKRAVYSLASMLLILLLAAQLVVFKSTALANSVPALQPMLLSLCNSLPCRYTGNHNSKQIKIVNRDVRLHPKIKGALLISATIVNQASYTQPYPTILLKFTDLTGNTVAQRYFPPKDYLGLLNKPFALMPSKKPVQLNIEILDPGSDAINFQFFFL